MKILFADEAFFNKDGITNTHNSHVWSPQKENPHSITETHFQTHFSVNIWCGITGILLITPFELEDLQSGLTGKLYQHFLQEELPQLSGDVPLDVRPEMCLQQDGAPTHFGGNAFLNQQTAG
jgi:hypothetical protein